MVTRENGESRQAAVVFDFIGIAEKDDSISASRFSLDGCPSRREACNQSKQRRGEW
jgi:hypothetical protein